MRFHRNYFFIASVGCLLFSGCAVFESQDSIQWTKYEGDPQNWPTQRVALMHLVDGFPVYQINQCPAEPYDVLGFIQAAKPPVGNEPVNEHAVVQQARAVGGDAVLISRESVPSVNPQQFQTDYLVIKFKPRPLATAIEHIDLFLALTVEDASGYTGLDYRGNTVHYTARQLAAERAELVKLRETLKEKFEKQKVESRNKN
jgi:hypothetical protein